MSSKHGPEHGIYRAWSAADPSGQPLDPCLASKEPLAAAHAQTSHFSQACSHQAMPTGLERDSTTEDSPFSTLPCSAPASHAVMQQQLPSSSPWPKVEPGSEPPRWLDMELNSPSNLIVLLDLNGTLSSVTAKRWLSHRKGIRPGMHHLRRLQVHAPPPAIRHACICKTCYCMACSCSPVQVDLFPPGLLGLILLSTS